MNPAPILAALALIASCRNGSGDAPTPAAAPRPPADVPTVTPMPTPPPDTSALDARLRRDFQARREHLSSASEWPSADANAQWHSPRGAPITHIVVVGQDPPDAIEPTPFTAYCAASEGRYWLHEGGGLSSTSNWWGPFPLP